MMRPWMTPSLLLIAASASWIASSKDTSTATESSSTSASMRAAVILTGDGNAIAQVQAKFKDFDFQDTYSAAEQKNLAKIGAHSLVHSKTVQLKKTHQIDQIRSFIRSSKLNVQIEENSQVSVKRGRNFKTQVNDPLMKEQWGIKNTGLGVRDYIDAFSSILVPGVTGEDIHIPAQSKEGAGILVAVLDTGIDLAHPDLTDSIYTRTSECETYAKYKTCVKEKSAKICDKTFQKIDTDGNGYPMDCHGWSMLGKKNSVSGITGNPDTLDTISHGSHVSGIIAAQADNKIGIRGVAPKAKILPVQVIQENPGDGSGSGDEDKAVSVLTAVARGINYAIASKANVINLSLGWNGRADSPTIRELVDKAEKAGIVIVAAAGNDGTDALVFPCQYSNVICVGAHGPDGKLSRFSNFGSGVDIAAPGLFILSTIPRDISSDFFTDEAGYDFKDGTSMATPYVSGAVAVLLSEGVPPQEVKARLLAGARRRPLVETTTTLSGNLDIEGALKAKAIPYIAPVEKGVHATIWDRAANTIPVRIDLKNIWADSAKTDITVRLSERDRASNNLSLEQSSFSISGFNAQSERAIEFNLLTRGGAVTSDITLYLDVRPSGGNPSTIRIMLLASSLLSSVAERSTTKNVPITEGSIIPDSTAILTFSAQDGKKERDYLVFKEGEGNAPWQFQILRETDRGYTAGAIREVPAFPRAAFVRSPLTLDVNLDGIRDYVIPITMMPKPGDKVPTFTFMYLNSDGKDVIAPYEFMNLKTTIMQLERYQWLKRSGRLVQAWLDYGNTPEVEKSKKYDPWNPKPVDTKQSRIYFHDPATPDGVRSFSPPKGYNLGDLVPVGTSMRNAGRILAILTKGDAYVNESFVVEVDGERGFGTPVPVRQDQFRNLMPLQDLPMVWLDGADRASIAYIGPSGVQGQRSTVLASDGAGGFATRDLKIQPFEKFETLYRMMSVFADSSEPGFISSYAQSDYLVYYSDSHLKKPLSTSLRRYNFLGSFLFDRTFYTAVIEIDGKRAGALQIPDLMGAYPGAEIIAPRFDPSTGLAVDLIRPAALRFLNDIENCEWLSRIDPTANEPSQAVYFCGDHFLRIPYRL